MMASSRSSWAQAPGTRSASRGPYRSVAPRRTSSTSQVCSVCPAGTGKSGSRGATRRRSKAHAGGDLGRLVDHPGPPGEPPTLLGLAPQAGGGRRGEPPFEVGEGPPGPHRGQGGGQGEPGRGGVVHVVGGHRGHPPLGGQQGQGVVAGGVDRVPVVPQLDGQVVAAEPPDQVVEGLGRGRRALGGEGGGQRPLAAPGEDLPVPAVTVGQVVEGDDRLPLLPAGQVGLGDDPAEAGVALGVPGQHDQVGAVGVGHAGPGPRPARPR